MHSSYQFFRKPDEATESEITQLIAQMTLEEKIDLLGGSRNWGDEEGNTRSCKRLGIPSFRMADASVGVHWWISATTTFPASIALAASFDTGLAREYALAIARDCRAGGIHILLGPGVNLYRSALCGRNFEYMGEDPALASRMAVAYIQALQSRGVAATLKHYALNYQEFERNKVSSDADERTMREVYLAAFEAGVKEGGAAAVMTAYNLVNGLHCAENGPLINGILKGEWGFDGLVMSDWVSVYDALNTARAGLDLEMPWARWMNREDLLPAVRDGRLAEKVLDDKVRRLLRMAKAFGWMDRPQLEEDENRPQKNAATALKVAQESMVLLKNDGILPLDTARIRTLALIGPHSDPAVISGGGSAYNEGWRSVSFYDGLKAAAEKSGFRLIHARGLDSRIAPDAFQAPNFLRPDGSPGVVAEYFNNHDFTGLPVLVQDEERINQRWNDQPIASGVEKTCFAIRYRAGFSLDRTQSVDLYFHLWDGGARIQVDGRVVHDSWEKGLWGLGDTPLELEAGTHQVVMEFRNIRTWNACCLGLDKDCRKSREHALALEAARTADAVVFCGGFNKENEAEGSDRTFAMPVDIEDLLMEVLDLNPSTILALTAGGNVDMGRWHDRIRALIHTWYPGQEGGTALADILTGQTNPSGRLPATFEARLQDRSSHTCYHDHDGDLRVALSDGIFGAYRHFDRTGTKPRYPFGYGLSYTTFSLDGLSLAKQGIRPGEGLALSFRVTNTGPRPGAEVPQIYLSPPPSSVPAPVKELKTFTKVFLQPGETRTLELSLKPRDFAHWSLDTEAWATRSGTWQVHLARNAGDIVMTRTVTLD